LQALKSLTEKTLAAISTCDSAQALYELKTTVLGKKGELTEVLKAVGQLPPEERPAVGQLVNQTKGELDAAFSAREQELQQKALAAKLQNETLDVSLPGRAPEAGRLHPISLSLKRIAHFFTHNGFGLEDGPQIEDDFHNFTALNIPEHHPARASHDTFYFKDSKLLRTHTSNVQIRYMKAHQPPLKIIAQGRVYRCDYDQTHSPMFHQTEGLWVDRDINFGNLKGLLQAFLEYFFEEKDLKLRFRPSYFPFTEPSAEVDVWFNGRWLEVLGCGMVHPNVLGNVGIDSEQFQGLAFGMGVERLTMVRYGITDLRQLFENDVRFLEQF